MGEITQQTIMRLMERNEIVSYSELCKKAGISRPSLYATMGKESPYREVVIKLARALNVHPAELITDCEEE